MHRITNVLRMYTSRVIVALIIWKTKKHFKFYNKTKFYVVNIIPCKALSWAHCTFGHFESTNPYLSPILQGFHTDQSKDKCTVNSK